MTTTANPLMVEGMALDLVLIRSFPRSLDYYRQAAEEVRWRHADLEARVVARFNKN